MTGPTLFQTNCESAIKNIPDNVLEDFKATKDEQSRIKLAYEYAKQMPIKLLTNGKSQDLANESKTKGNSLFSKKDYKNALVEYNKGILLCPQDSDSSRELLTILISNRSATYFELNEFKKVFNDIDFLLEIGNYPLHLQYKIWLRKAKCFQALQNEKSASETFRKAIDSLKHSKLGDSEIQAKIQEIENLKLNKTVLFKENNELANINEPVFVGGNYYIAAHSKIDIQQDSVQGRYAVAVENIEAGIVVLEENPHSSVLTSDNKLTNCQHCVGAIEQPIPCPNCAYVFFCSSICEKLANKSYHQSECPIQSDLDQSGASVNCFLALRIISQKPLAFYLSKKKQLQSYLKDSCKKTIIRKKTYRSDDYENFFFLCRNEDLRRIEELLHFSCMAVYLLRLLKLGNYFGPTNNDVLTEDELFIGCLILRHLEILQFNAHEISELRNFTTPKILTGVETAFENYSIGAAVYPTLALFNHSCDPSIVRYNVKNRIIVRTIKPIKAGDIIYENYGPLFMSMPIEERRLTLKKKYLFECLCLPCIQMWPTFDEMDSNELRIPCNTVDCPYIFLVRGVEDPFFTCEYCGNMTSIIPHLKSLMGLGDILDKAENLYSSNDLPNALKIFSNAIEILYKFTRPPHTDMVKIQERMRVCMVHFGNKTLNYKAIL